MSAIDALLNNELNDGEITLTVDEQTRSIKYDGSLLLGVEKDYQAERIYFIIPKIIGDDIDLSSNTIQIFINFQNAVGEPYIYECTDKAVLEDGTVKVSWLLTEKVTEAKGTVKFMLCIKHMVNDMVHNEWHTAPFEGQVLKGIDVSNKTPEIIADTTASTAALIRQLEQSEEAMNAAVKQCDDIVSGYEATIERTLDNLQGYTKDEVDEFKNDSDSKINNVSQKVTTLQLMDDRIYVDAENFVEDGQSRPTWGALINYLTNVKNVSFDYTSTVRVYFSSPSLTIEDLEIMKQGNSWYAGSYGKTSYVPTSKINLSEVMSSQGDRHFYTNAGGQIFGNVIVINEDDTNGVVLHREGKITGYDSVSYIRFAPENGNIYYATFEDVQNGVERELGAEKQTTAYTLFSGDYKVYSGTSESGITQTSMIMFTEPAELDDIKVGDKMRVYFYGGSDSPGSHNGMIEFELVKTTTNGGITGSGCIYSHGGQDLLIGAHTGIFSCHIIVRTLSSYSGYEPSKQNSVHVNKIELIRYS